MLKLIKFLKTLKSKGFASADEKAEMKTLLKELTSEEQEEVKEEVAEAEKLPEEDPKEGDELEKNIKALIKGALKGETKEAMEKAIGDIKTEVKTFVEKEMEAMKAKAGNYHPDVQEKRQGVNTYLRKYTRALISGDVEELKNLNKVATVKELTTDKTGTPFGGYVVDHELSAEIRALTTEYGVARAEFMAVPLSKNSYDANTLTTDVVGYWVDEAGSIKSTGIVLGQGELKLKKLGAIVTLTRELLEDEEIDLFSFIATRVAEVFAKMEDTAFFMGAGTGDTANAEYTGILKLSTANIYNMASDKDAFEDLTADDLLKMQDKSPQSLAKNGKYYMHRSIRNIVRMLKSSTTGTYIYQDATNNGPAMLWGRPVVEVEVMPDTADSDGATPFIIYGDLKKACLLGYKNALAADMFDAGSVRNIADNADINLITTDRKAIRWIQRVGYLAIMPSYITVCKTGSGS